MNGKIVDLVSSGFVNSSHLSAIRLLIVDDQNSICQRLKLLLESEANIEVVGVAANGAVAIKQVESLQPDVILLDLEMPEMDGVKATQIISKRFPNCQILILSSHETQEYLNRALDAGAKGYLLKNTPAAELLHAIESVYRGYAYINSQLWNNLRQPQPETVSKPNQPNLLQKNNFTPVNTPENQLRKEK